MINTDFIEEAKMSLVQAVTRSNEAGSPADRPGRAAQEHLFGAELKLRQGGRPDLATRLEKVLSEDVTSSKARSEMREVAQKLDAELSPDVTTTSFVTASDGGERR